MSKTAIQCAQDIINTCVDMYDEDLKLSTMTEKQAYDFCVEHIEFIIGTNGHGYLWFVELQAIKELDLFNDVDMTPEEVEQSLKTYELV